jgi:hypothetical protein
MYKDYSNNFETATETCQQLRENSAVTAALDVCTRAHSCAVRHSCNTVLTHPPHALSVSLLSPLVLNANRR